MGMSEPTLYQTNPNLSSDTVAIMVEEKMLLPVEPERNEVWLSDVFGAYRVIDDNDTVVDTVTDVRRKVYLGAERGR
jgi:hypothetical protein